jgi:group I intron endonuclease
MPNYSLGKIYKIVNSENEKVYIGSTVQRLSKRMAGHRDAVRAGEELSRFYKAMRKIGIDKFKIELVKEFPCSDKKELETEEFRIIQKVKKRGVSLYNMFIEKRGNVRFEAEVNRWLFQYYPVIGENQKKKSWAVNKYGADEAKEMAIAYQDMIYPKI